MKDIKFIIQGLANSLAQNTNGKPFYYYAEGRLLEYIGVLEKNECAVKTLLSKIDDMNGDATPRRFIGLMKSINEQCLKILERAYAGDIFSALNELKSLLVRKYTKYKLKKIYVEYIRCKNIQYKEMYRCVDFDKGVKPKSCGQLPFEMRECASKGRFNQLGTICLYLSNSLECAQKEIGEKVRNGKIRWYGKFCPKAELSFMDFSIPKKKDLKRWEEEDLFAFLLTYPLRVLCLAKGKNHKKVSFVEEYLFSQLFLHILLLNGKIGSKLNFEGICYSSAKSSECLNFVIPAKYETRTPPCSGKSPYIDRLLKEEIIDCVK